MADENILDHQTRKSSHKAAAQEDADKHAAIATLEGRYVYITGSDRWFDTRTSTLLQKTAVDISHRSELGRSASYSLIEAQAVEIVQRITWVPNGPRFITEGDTRSLNVYEPPRESPLAGDVSPYLELAEYIVPDAKVREHILDWSAFVIQHPEQKPNWHPLLGGAQGIGKDALIFPIKRAVGFHNTVTIDPDDLESQFNDQVADKKLGILNEILSFRDRRFEDKLKKYTAAPPHELTINPKGASKYTVPNIIALFGMTNHRSQGMTLSKGDRRWMPFWSPARPLSADYYTELWEYLEGDGGLHVWHWLANRDLSAHNPKAHAPDTEYKRELVEVSEDPNLAVLRDRIDERGWPFDSDLVAIDQVMRFLDDSRLDRGKVGSMLRELGCKDARPAIKIDGGTKRKRVWIVRRHEFFEGMPSADLYKAAEVATQSRMGTGNQGPDW